MEVGAPDAVPGKVINSLNLQSTLQRVEGDTIREYSYMLYRRLSGAGEGSTDVRTENIFSLLRPEDCEDLVGLYLQEQGYRLIPSTCKTSTVNYEYVLKHSDTGEKAFAQVKRGGVPLNAEDYESLDGTVYLFTSGGAQHGEAPNVTFIDPGAIRDFLRENRQVLPDRILKWAQVLNDGD